MTRSYAHIVFARGEERIAEARKNQEDRRADVARRLVEHAKLKDENLMLKGIITTLRMELARLKGEWR